MTTAPDTGQDILTANASRHAYRPAAHPIVRIHLLGPMRATSYLGEDVLPRAKKARAALGYLCLAFGARVPRVRVASILWDRVNEAQARTSFRQVVSELISAMGCLSPELISTGRATIRFNTDACWIDALALLESSQSDRTRTDLAVLCGGELLEGMEDVSEPFVRWLTQERIRFKQEIKPSLDIVLQQTHRSRFDPNQLAGVARRLISIDPTHQGASRALMRALAKLGQREQALLEYERCREALMKAFHVKPSIESERLYEAMRALWARKTAATTSVGSAKPQRINPEIHQPLPGRHRLRVGVLPFDATESENERNMAFSLSHDIAAALARFRWFDVITPVSMLDKPLANLLSQDVFQHQQLDYAIDGVVKKYRGHYHIDVWLLDLTRCSRPVWSDRFRLRTDELHQLNEMVISRVVASIDPVIIFIEGEPRRRKRYGATGLLFLAIPLLYSMERHKYQEAGELIEQAIGIEPDNAMALTWSAYWHLWNAGQCWTPDVEAALLKAENLCLRAMDLDPDNSEPLGIYAHTLAWKKEFDRALYFFDRSLRLNPNLAYIWALSAPTYCYIGKPEEALRRLSRYRDLAPFDPYFGFFENAYAMAYMFKGDHERAVIVGRRVVKTVPEFINGYKPLIASLGHLGRRDEAAPYVKKLLSLEPDFSVEKFGKVYPFKLAEDRENYCNGLRLAGVPKR
jgi:DNA-binding SARP family transcriptional activator